MRYAFFGNDGRVAQACNDDTVVEIPQGAVELTEDQFAQRFDLRIEVGRLIVDPLVYPVHDVIDARWVCIKLERERRAARRRCERT